MFNNVPLKFYMNDWWNIDITFHEPLFRHLAAS